MAATYAAGASPHAFAIAGLLGWPVAHSRSPVIHNFWLREHGIAGRFVRRSEDDPWTPRWWRPCRAR